MLKLSKLIGKIPAIDSYLRYDDAYKIKPKAKQMTELQEAVILKQQRNKTLQEASKPVQTNLINQNHLGNPIAKDEESLKRFWKWFGKSATVDQKGRPFVFYHGSAYTFSKFDAGQIIGQLEGDNAVFFSTSKKFAEEFGSDRVAYKDALEAGDEDAHEGSLNIPSDEDDYIDEEHLEIQCLF